MIYIGIDQNIVKTYKNRIIWSSPTSKSAKCEVGRPKVRRRQRYRYCSIACEWGAELKITLLFKTNDYLIGPMVKHKTVISVLFVVFVSSSPKFGIGLVRWSAIASHLSNCIGELCEGIHLLPYPSKNKSEMIFMPC